MVDASLVETLRWLSRLSFGLRWLSRSLRSLVESLAALVG